MTKTPESFLLRFEIPAILAISTLLIAAAVVKDHGPWQAATTALFTAATIAVSFALVAAIKYRHRWP
ncbi:MAG: hypothetical protein AB7P50_22315 [Alphaproteobacteria bacterium]